MFRFLDLIFCTIFALLLFTQCTETNSGAKEIVKKEATVLKEKEVAPSPTVDKDTIQLAQKTASKTALVAEKPTTAAAVKEDKPKELATEKEKIAKKASKKEKRKKKRAKIKFDKTIHKFGKIKEGDKITHKFTFKNIGNAPLVIKNVDVSCGCTFPSYPFLPIEPNEKGEIEVTFNSKHKVGRQKPFITVITNGRPRSHKLYLEGFVE